MDLNESNRSSDNNVVPPELMPSLAYRRAGSPELFGRKIIKCPYCREIIMDVDRTTMVEIFRLPKSGKKKIKCQEYKKCDICKNEFGYNIKDPVLLV